MSNASSSKKSNYRPFGSVIKLKSGKFQASYKRTVGGKPKTFYGPHAYQTKTEANNWLAMEQNLLATHKWTLPGLANPLNTETPTFGVYAERHIALQTNSKGEHLKPSTAEKYRTYIAKYLATFSNVRLNEITKAMVDEWWSKAISKGKLTTASKAYKFMHSVYVRAIADGWMMGNPNPCQVKGAQNANSGQATYTPSLEEVALVASHIKPQFRTLVILATYGALRFGEVTALQRKHFQLKTVEGKQRYEVTIEQALTYVEKRFIMGTPKNAKGAGTVLLPSAITELLGLYLNEMVHKSPETYLFTNALGGFVRNDVLAKALKSASKKAGLGDKAITPHSLRRAGGTAYGNLGANINEVKAFIRDGSTAAAVRYVQTTNRTISIAEGMPVYFAERDTPPSGLTKGAVKE